MMKSFLPGYYLFHSRLKTTMEKVSWFIIYFIPIYIIGLYHNSSDYLSYSIIFSLSVLIFNSVYELGYIENDTRTILTEEKPTIRLNHAEYKYYEEKYYPVISCRILISILLLYFTSKLSGILSINIYVMQYILLLITIRILFYFHNIIRSKMNILTFFSLSTTKYCAPLFLLIPSDSILAFWTISFFLFPTVRTMEHACKQKYNLNKWISFVGNHDLFRIKYYTVVAIAALILYITIQKTIIFLSLALLIYFLFFRIVAYLLVKNNYYHRSD